MRITDGIARWGNLFWMGICVLLIAPPALEPAWAQSQDTRAKRTRQIGVMEGIIDQVLIDSPNLLVFGRDHAHGLYLEEFGAVFAFEASLTGRMAGLELIEQFGFQKGSNLSLKWDKGGEPRVLILEDEKDKKEKQEEGEDSAQNSEEEKSTKSKIRKIREREAKEEEDQASLYKKGKAEIVQVLLDYGDTMTSLRDDQWLGVAAFLQGSDFFINSRISRLIVKAKMQDLRGFSAGRLSEPEMRSRVVEEEY